MTVTDEKRAFLKVLRYGLPTTRPTATRATTTGRLDGSDFLPWFWQPIADDALKLPPITSYAGMPFPVLDPVTA